MGSHRLLRVLCAGLFALTVVACGGGSDDAFVDDGNGGMPGTPGTPTPPAVTPAAITVSLPAGAQLPSDADTIEEGLPIVVLAVDANNNALPGVVLTFSASSGELSVSNATTNDTGRASAILTTASSTVLRNITVSATAGGVTGTAMVSVVAPTAPGPGASAPAAITISLPAGSQLPSDADTIEEGLPIVVLAVDRNNNALPGVVLSFSATSGELSVTNATTNSTGRASAVLTTASNTALRTITVVASSGTVQGTTMVSVVAPIVNNPPSPRLGFIQANGTFTAGAIGIAVSPVSAGGSSGLRVDVVDVANGNAVITAPVTVNFTSTCITAGTAAVTPNPATSANGAVNTTYVASGCSGNDTITAQATISGSSQSASGIINVLPSTLGSVEFVSATPTNIGLRGSGGTVASTVRFRVRNSVGGVVAGQTVNFALNTTVGGIMLNPTSGMTDATGIVQTVVSAGTVATSVRVTANATQGSITASSQSEQLTITTGIPDQNSFSLSASVFNIEGGTVDGVTSLITLRAADRYNNPVPNGTAVNFTTEGGSIVGSCTTTGGACTVTWTSQDSRPGSFNGCIAGSGTDTDAACGAGGSSGASRAGRSTVLAFSVGEESFTDADGDGLFDAGEPRTDLPEAFVDSDEDRVRDATELPFDFNVNGVYDVADGKFNGLLCDNGNPNNIQCPIPQTLHVRDSVVIVMSGSSAAINRNVFVPNSLASGGDITVLGPADYNVATGTITISANSVFILRAVVRDANEQPMPATTTVAFTASGDAGALQGTTTFRVPNTFDDRAGANLYGVGFKGADIDAGDPDGASTLELNVTSPGGVITPLPFTVNTESPRLVSLSGTGSPLAENGGVATVRATLNRASVFSVTVALAFSGTATQGLDYAASPGGSPTLTFAPGVTSIPVTLSGIDDMAIEGAETVVVDITSVTGASALVSQFTATITDDD